MKRLSISLPIGNNYGWGVCGLNLTKALDRVTGSNHAVELYSRDANNPLKHLIPEDWDPRYPRVVDNTMLHAISGPTMFPSQLLEWSSTRNIGLCFIEDPDLAAKFKPIADSYYDHIITGSTWCTNQLRSRGFVNVSTAFQGVDPNVFYPAKDKVFPTDKFVLGSFGKFEYRKGQDIVIAVFKKLLDKYPQVHLLCGWGNLWPDTMDTMAQSDLIKYVRVQGDWKTKVKATMILNDIPSDRYTLLDMRSHEEMADVYRGVHLGLAFSRVEAGNNLPVIEMCACGVQVCLSASTGHMDIWNAVVGSNTIPSGYKSVDDWVVSVENFIRYPHKAPIYQIINTVNGFNWDKMASEILRYA